ncbi:thaumatin-like protein 1 isoform X2 [Henckelia pumila]|uniref:thaumatin-like protein 1 isoform X2 n=1 Tax=Henckelia pumila TaxID=405737 RepID=UPI003C6DBAAF
MFVSLSRKVRLKVGNVAIMDASSSYPSSSFISSLLVTLLLFARGAFGATFTFVNRCEETVWPGILANAGSPKLETTGFELPQGSYRTLMAPAGWSGRFWGRTVCTFPDSEPGSCRTADCGSGELECNGFGAAPPVTLAEFTLGTGGLDFYDVSLVDGYNLPMIVEAAGGSGMCASTGCVTDLNRVCPSELRVEGVEACKSACEAFGSPEYCCSGAFNSPAACRPSVYAQVFKSACPRSYSYAYDDPTSTFTCSGADYTVTFCPSVPSQKSSKDLTPATTTNGGGYLSGSDPTGMSGPGLGISGSEPDPDSGSGSGSESGSQAFLTDGSWLADLAMGDSARVYWLPALHSAVLIFVLGMLCL